MEQISMPLAHVFKMSLQEGIVHLEWKEENINIIAKIKSISHSFIQTKRFKKQVRKSSTSQFKINNLQSIRNYNQKSYGGLSQQM